jgi:hypothetical protein
MGEYAIRKSDGADIKIGTCESMYYMTFRQWANKDIFGGDTPTKDVLKHINFRLPRLDEKDIKVGDFEHFQAQPLPLFLKRYRNKIDNSLNVGTTDSDKFKHWDFEESDFTKEIRQICFDNSGFIQMAAKMQYPHDKEKWGFEETAGILASVPCYHGFTTEDPKGFGYNGFNSHVLAVMRVAAREIDGVYKAVAVIGCRACGSTIFSVDIDELMENFGITEDNRPGFWYLINELEYMQTWLDENMNK